MRRFALVLAAVIVGVLAADALRGVVFWALLAVLAATLAGPLVGRWVRYEADLFRRATRPR